jgi:predicted nucleic acid-binding protein
LAEISEWLEKQQFERTTKLATVKHTTTVLELDHAILEQAGILKVQKRKTVPDFGLIDAIILATAKTHHLAVITSDRHFQNEKIVQL